jgi:hypothetical protein
MLNTHKLNNIFKLNTKTCALLIATFALLSPVFARAESGPNTNSVPDLQKHLELAIALHKNQAHDQAIALLDQLIDWAPDNTVFSYNKAYILKTIGRPHEAIPCYNHVLTQVPEHDHAHYGLAQASLAAGDLKNGFYHFQWRLANKKKWEHVTIPEDLTGIDIVLRAEFGFGDMFQFVRYAHELKKRGCATVAVQAFKAQVPLFKLCPYIDHVIEEYDQLPDYGLHIPLLSVPHLLGTTLDTIPAPIPYLHADPELVIKWLKLLDREQLAENSLGHKQPISPELSAHKLDKNNKNFKIGICWQGKAQHFLEENPLTKRSVPLALFAPLAALPGVTLYSLQNGPGTEQLDSVNFAVHEFGPDFDSSAGRFMDTAAVIKNMDLVISVDTSLVHLAGGLGARTWVLIPYVPEWRWLETRTDTPWYPEIMRLFRQPEPGNWELVMADIVIAVRELLAK